MFYNYLKIALRNFLRHKTYSGINLLGLSIGITCCLLISLFLQHEWSFDTFHSKADRLYRAYVKETYKGDSFMNVATAYPLGPAMKTTYPEVEAMTRILQMNGNIKKDGDTFSEAVYLVEPDFFKMFDFPLLSAVSKPLSQPQEVILTEEMAKKYFGADNPVGKIINLQLDSAVEAYTVTAVAKNSPINSSIRFGILVPFQKIVGIRSPKMMQHWQQIEPETYVLLKEGTVADKLMAKFPAMVKVGLGKDFNPNDYVVNLQPITDIHLNNELPEGLQPISNPMYSYILGTIALFILLIACINFVTLSIGQSASRAREVGVRKVLGAFRKQLVQQFWGEAILMTVLAVSVGILLAIILLPAFNQLAELQLGFKITPFTILFILGLIAIIGIIAGSYPALVLSGFRPIEVLKGKLSVKGDQSLFRRGIVVVQFGLSVFLIIGTLVMNRQMNYLQEKPLGYKPDRTVIIPVTKGGDEGRAIVTRFQNTLKDQNEIENLTASSFPFGAGEWAGIGFTDKNKVYREAQLNVVDPNFIPTYNIKMAAGRNFDKNNSSDVFQSIIVNEAFVKEYGWKDPLNERLPGNFPAHRIIGVVKDFHYESLHTPVKPLILAYRPDSLYAGIENIGYQSSPRSDISVRLHEGDIAEQISLLEKAWKVSAPDEPFSYTFLDQNLASQYRQETRLGKLVTIASCLSIFIASLGLFGLATLAVVRRTKEIGVRKVLGASVGNIVQLLSKDFVQLVLIGNVIAWPLAWYAMHQWLQDFAFQVNINFWVFGLAGFATVLIALLTVSFHSVKAAIANPVKALRTE